MNASKLTKQERQLLKKVAGLILELSRSNAEIHEKELIFYAVQNLILKAPSARGIEFSEKLIENVTKIVNEYESN